MQYNSWHNHIGNSCNGIGGTITEGWGIGGTYIGQYGPEEIGIRFSWQKPNSFLLMAANMRKVSLEIKESSRALIA